jgi:small conductance mechanosensitive channel
MNIVISYGGEGIMYNYSMFHLNPDEVVSKIVVTVLVLVVDLIFSIIAKKLVDVLIAPITHRFSSERMVARTETLRGLFKNVIDFTLFMIAILIILSYWGINIIPILTGASILGLAVSFGAQTFIKDVIAGMFIILEDQFHIGDMVKVDKYEGEVVNISLRLTILRDSKGNYIYMPNSQITTLIRLKTTKKL